MLLTLCSDRSTEKVTKLDLLNILGKNFSVNVFNIKIWLIEDPSALTSSVICPPNVTHVPAEDNREANTHKEMGEEKSHMF